jgi:flagellar basal-body rod modification protein FlgD
MAVTNPVNAASAASGASAALAAYQTPSTAKKDATEDRFLALLVSQLKNQDPLNPLQNSEVTSQLAQINTVKGIEKLNETVTSLLGQMDSGQSLQAAALVGRRVLVPGSALQLAGGEASAGFSLAAKADAVTVTVKDANGAVLHRADLGTQASGLHMFTWDGMTDAGQAAVPGLYSFEITATAGGKATGAEALSVGRVDGVVPGKDGISLNLGGLPSAAFAQVRQIL